MEDQVLLCIGSAQLLFKVFQFQLFMLSLICELSISASFEDNDNKIGTQ